MDRNTCSLPETSSLLQLRMATDLERIALFHGILNRSPISGHVPYLFECRGPLYAMHGPKFMPLWVYEECL